MKLQLIFRAVLFAFLFPGIVTVLAPSFILGQSMSVMSPELSLLTILATFVGVISAGILLHCIWAFAFYGKGTLSPIDPPVSLVVHGLYRYSRNPMYLAVILVLLSETLFFQSLTLLCYTIIILICFYLFVRLYEEPYLRKHFGEQYSNYCRRVPRWGITFHPYNNNGGAA
jgi:protein-S-isoprenylcysteine O-methyltransferase Ste14